MILGIRTLFLGLSVAITQAVYPLIPRLYKLFIDAANFEFLSEKLIYRIWNNLYVLVGVIVLFAIAIKLISAIVNPDTLADNKKGAKGAYFRTVIAVILIFICPLIFNLARQVQSDLLADNFLISRVFGYETKSSSVGQMLAWETFSAFCTPVDEVTRRPLTAEELEMDKTYSEYFSVGVDIDNIEDLDFELFYSKIAIPAGDLVNYSGIKYNSLLCPLAGILVAYELLLLCMDTVFRAAKLAILQLMLPIVLGAYVFNPDILKKWAKEYVSTFIVVFLKVIAIGFVVIAITELKGVIF